MRWLIRKIPRPGLSDPLFEPPGWDWARTGEVGWWVRSDWHRVLLGPGGLRLDEWRSSGRLTIVNTRPHRVVYRVDLPEGAIYVKHFLVPGLRAKLRQWVRRGKGRNEGQRTRYLNAIGVQTITPIALGEQRKRRFLFENFLITHAISDAVPLNEFVENRLPLWPEEHRARVRQRLAVSLATLTARLHDSGFVHQDFHPGNILVQISDDDRPQLAMIDLDALRVTRPVWQFWEDLAGRALGESDARHWSPPLTWPEAQLNLALLNHYFWLRCGRSDRYRFLRAYLRARRCSPPDPTAFARGIEDATRAWAERLWRRWGRRCHGTNKYFKAYSGDRTWAVASRDLDSATVRALLADPDAVFRREGTVILKDSRTTTVAEATLEVRGRPTRVIYKRFNKKRWFEPFLTYFRPSSGWQSWQAAQHLASRAIPTPRNLAFLARLRRFPRDLFWYLPHETYLITVKEEPSITLGDYVRKVLPALPPDARRRQIRRLTLALARLLRMLHERSLSHRDLKAANLLLLGDPSSPDVQLTVIDLAGVRLIHPLPRHRQVQNLARLNLSLVNVTDRTRTDTLRFLRAYLNWGLSPRNDWKGFWRLIAEASRTKMERNERRGRALS
ncbi:MAG: phosphotransferase [Singulisphaera sp.]|nr:phosphotransferase [Singulisphaera sp.]